MTVTDEQKFGIILSLDDADFTDELRLTAAIMKNVVNQMKEDASIKLDLSAGDVAGVLIFLRTQLSAVKEEIKNTEDEAERGQLNERAKELSDTIEFLTNNTDRLVKAGEEGAQKLNIDMKSAITSASKLALRLVGIRSIWSVISKASSSYMQENKIINEQLKITFSILGNLIGPVVKELINIVEYAVIIIAKLVNIMTGYDAISKTNVNSLKNLRKEAQKTQKALAGFDTISNMTDNSDAMENYRTMLDAYNDFQDKVDQIDSIFNKWGKDIAAFLIILAGLWGAKTLSGISQLIGTAGTATSAGTGLAGVSSLCASLATLTAIVITIYFVAKGVEQIKEINEYLDTYNSQKTQDKVKKVHNELEDIGDITTTQKVNTNSILQAWDDAQEPLYKINGWNEKILVSMENQVKVGAQTATQYKNALKTQQLTEENAQEILDAAKSQVTVNNELEKVYQQQGKDTQFIVDSNNDYKDILSDLYDKYVIIDGEVVGIRDTTQELNDMELKEKNMTINMIGNASDLESKSNNWFTAFTGKLATWANDFLSTTALGELFYLGKKYIGTGLPQFDVGTNYVPSDMLAMVHKGEMIVPAKYNPLTSGLGTGSNETNSLLRQLNETLENKQFNGYITSKEIVDTAIQGINQKSRIMGRSVIK